MLSTIRKFSKAASSVRISRMALNSVEDVDIDPQGRFKYILINVADAKSTDKKLIVRGYGKYTCLTLKNSMSNLVL